MTKTPAVSVIIPQFNAAQFVGRLALLQLDRNTGSGAVPRNIGLKFARGEFVYFIDADDMLTLTALEELYVLAERFNADVVYCEKYYAARAEHCLRVATERRFNVPPKSFAATRNKVLGQSSALRAQGVG